MSRYGKRGGRVKREGEREMGTERGAKTAYRQGKVTGIDLIE